jgi:hypothetical protein
MNKYILIVLYLCYPIFFFAQDDISKNNNEILFGLGYMEYMNTRSIPSGLPGTVYRLEYNNEKSSEKHTNLKYGFFAQMNYSQLLKHDFISDFPYHHGELALGGLFLQKISNPIPHFDMEAGLGLSFNALTGKNYSRMADLHLNSYGYWLISPDLYLNFYFQINKIKVKTGFYLPLTVYGFYPEYQYIPTNYKNLKSEIKYYCTPNSFAFMTDYFCFYCMIAASYKLHETPKSVYNISLKYSYQSLKSNIHYYTEQKQRNILSLGFQILRK